jgi:hypothetical protein
MPFIKKNRIQKIGKIHSYHFGRVVERITISYTPTDRYKVVKIVSAKGDRLNTSQLSSFNFPL